MIITKKEQSNLEQIKQSIENDDDLYFTHHGQNDASFLISIINRLEARCKELESERASSNVWVNFHNTNIHNAKLIEEKADAIAIAENTQTQWEIQYENLYSLLEAAEMVIKENFDKPMYNDPVSGYLCLKFGWWYKFQDGLRQLNQVVRKIKGEK